MKKHHSRREYVRALFWMFREFGVRRTLRYERYRLSGRWIYYTPEQAAVIAEVARHRRPLAADPIPVDEDVS